MGASEDAVTAAELGEFVGMATRSVVELAKRGIAVKAGPNRYRLKESVARYCDDLRRQAKGKGGEGAASERGRLAAAQASYVEMKTRRQNGELLDAKAVEAEWSDILRTVRSGVLSVPSRLTQLGPQDRAALDAELRRVLTELGGKPANLGIASAPLAVENDAGAR
jgi:phage terminase Nu1 subunit (DNA packaging protein)